MGEAVAIDRHPAPDAFWWQPAVADHDVGRRAGRRHFRPLYPVAAMRGEDDTRRRTRALVPAAEIAIAFDMIELGQGSERRIDPGGFGHAVPHIVDRPVAQQRIAAIG